MIELEPVNIGNAPDISWFEKIISGLLVKDKTFI